MNTEQFFIGGRWVAPTGSGRIAVVDSYTEEPFASVAEGTEADINAAVAAARSAAPGWAAETAEGRGGYLRRIHGALAARAEEVARTITREVGMPIKMSRRMQVGAPLAILESAARHASTFTYEERVGNSLVVREPVGVVGAITAWNYPLYLLAAKVGSALAAGCTVVLKPSELAPLSALAFADAVREAGLPPGVFNLVVGYGPVAGEALARHPGVDALTFTGSTRAGKRVAQLAAGTVKRVALELGGKSASIVLDDADLAVAVKATVNMCFLNSGQTCAALTRLLVPQALQEEAARLAVEVARSFTPGDPSLESTRLGPLASAAQRERVRGHIATGTREGAALLCGGTEPPPGLAKGYFVQPTVFGRVDPRSAIAQEEIFGPVLSIIPCRDEDEAVAIANGTSYGLAGAVWSADERRAEAVARRMRTGQVDINGGAFNLEAPFGGYGQSGIGREMGRFGLEEFLEHKAMQFRS
jgi:betaine-aldehyde dehydrogenase